MLKKFSQAREQLLPVHGRMLQPWALLHSNQTGVNLTASSGWLQNLKKRNGIVSRKVTLYTTRIERKNEEAIVASIERFKSEHSESINFGMEKIWNVDQTGLNYESANQRTLSFKGERDTNLILDSKNKHTHSYTVQPVISRSGRLFQKLLIVTQEQPIRPTCWTTSC